jgi:hypothetical protein
VIRLARTARTQISGLARHYRDLDRPKAVANLRAPERIELRRGPFFPALRPYPNLTPPGWLWLKEGPNWIAYVSDSGGALIQAVFHEAADIPNRI